MTPLSAEVNIASEAMLAASIRMSDDTVDTSEGNQLSSGRRGGSIWGE